MAGNGLRRADPGNAAAQRVRFRLESGAECKCAELSWGLRVDDNGILSALGGSLVRRSFLELAAGGVAQEQRDWKIAGCDSQLKLAERGQGENVLGVEAAVGEPAIGVAKRAGYRVHQAQRRDGYAGLAPGKHRKQDKAREESHSIL